MTVLGQPNCVTEAAHRRVEEAARAMPTDKQRSAFIRRALDGSQEPTAQHGRMAERSASLAEAQSGQTPLLGLVGSPVSTYNEGIYQSG